MQIIIDLACAVMVAVIVYATLRAQDALRALKQASEELERKSKKS